MDRGAQKKKRKGWVIQRQCVLICVVALAIAPSLLFLRRMILVGSAENVSKRLDEQDKKTLHNQISMLKSEVSMLRSENSDLRNTVTMLRSQNEAAQFPIASLPASDAREKRSRGPQLPLPEAPPISIKKPSLGELRVEDMVAQPPGNSSMHVADLLSDIIGSHAVKPSDQSTRPSETEETGGQDLAIGMCSGIKASFLSVFVRSLRMFSECRIVLFIDTAAFEASRDMLEGLNITLIAFSPSELNPAYLRGMHPSSYRWHLIHHYIREETKEGAMFRNILLADVRDTAFEGNPFSLVKRKGLHVFSEDKQIMNDEWNSGWIASCFGMSKAQELSYNEVICSGIILGTGSAVIKYLDIFDNVLGTNQFRSCERNGVDQGVHNVLVHTNRAIRPMLHIHSQATGRVAHMQAGVMKADPPEFVVKNSNHETAIIVHQYDRNLHVQSRYLNAFAKEQMQRVETSAGNGSCTGYNYSHNSELFKGVGDINPGEIPYRSETIKDCCILCNQNPRCTAFTFFTVSFQCWLKDTSAIPVPIAPIYVPDVISAERTEARHVPLYDPYAATIRSKTHNHGEQKRHGRDYESMGYPLKKSTRSSTKHSQSLRKSSSKVSSANTHRVDSQLANGKHASHRAASDHAPASAPSR